MADALTRLVQRALHPHAGVLPRPRTRFEAFAADQPHEPTPALERTAPPIVLGDEPGTMWRWDAPRDRMAEPVDPTTRVRPHPTIAAPPPDRAPTLRVRDDGPPARVVAEVAPPAVGRANDVVTADQSAARRVTAAPMQQATVVPVTARPAERLVRRTVSAEPVVHISIGRVEVRAEVTSSAAAAAPPAPERRVTPLDEYLAGRAEGRPR